ncbi:MAG: tRNA (adenosine(37)-N6)-threonylcarbamoyltransferase complex dimerization subunit type 1 TsaB [Desulfobacterales bacterium]|jgi:tRNA threonylcarbamoyladenosine biosynthesis protein TsaB
MKILAVDTAAKSCSIAIVDDEALLAELSLVRNQTHSKHLMEMIKRTSILSGIAISAMDGFAVTRGPGSFTGLRIGLSTVKGLAAASGKPVVGVSSLKVLALQSCPSAGIICPIIDARRKEIYTACFRYIDGQLNQLGPERVGPLRHVLNDLDEPCTFVGNGAILYREVIRETMGEFAQFAPASQSIIRGATVAFLSMRRFQNADVDDAASLTPIYIRQSDAEMNLARRHQNNG